PSVSGFTDGVRSSSHSRSGSHDRHEEQTDTSDSESFTLQVRKMNQQPAVWKSGEQGYDPNRFRLHLEKESREEIERRKKVVQEKIVELIPETELEVDIVDIYKPGSVLDFPKRSPWSYTMTKEQLLVQEEKAFREYLDKIYRAFDPMKLSYFEHNLETWRQLWRVLEMSDIVLLITDVRHPKRRRRRRVRTMAVGPKQLLKACENITQGKVDLASWKEKMERDAANTQHEDLTDEEDEDDAVLVEHQTDSAMEMCALVDELYRDGILTVGCVGFPNVGKSSLINGLVGKKVVSVSRTPGHTKYFQTYFLTPTVKLCDCPGLIFPSLVDRQQQILSGIYPVAQIQEPYTSVGYLAARIPVAKLLKLKHPTLEEGRPEEQEQAQARFTAWDICEAWAEKRGYKTAKAARNDVYRAANSILRLTVDGRLCLCMRPPGYTVQKAEWQLHVETLEIAALQEAHRQQTKQSSEDEDEISSSDQEDDEKDHDADEEEEEEEEEERGEGGDAGHRHKGAFLSKNKFALLRDDEC
ncbi:hypothetical protein chiPu_0020876, partial [Chiloscyllium punctatum]|nr:hypothetical protein [Chiloscyllium punctatum]